METVILDRPTYYFTPDFFWDKRINRYTVVRNMKRNKAAFYDSKFFSNLVFTYQQRLGSYLFFSNFKDLEWEKEISSKIQDFSSLFS